MPAKLYELLKRFLSIDVVSDSYKKEFETGINSINVTRAKITSMTFVGLELMMIVVVSIIKGPGLFKKPDIYYEAMYVLMLSVMLVYFLIFVKLGKDVPGHETGIMVSGVTFTSFILLWCAGISLLDQLTSGQVIVYVVAIISVAITPLFKPFTLLLIYLVPHLTFLILMPYLQKSSGILFGNYINSTTFVIVSWAISCMRYKKHVEDFNNKKLIQRKSEELKRINKELEDANRKLEKLSQTDSLTGVYNRFMFDKAVKIEWNRCRRHSVPLSLIMIDIDLFKSFNDNYGHQNGDDCIRQIAGALSACSKRSSDIVARYGGEEFAILLPHMNKENTLVLAEQMRKMVEELAIPHAYSSISEYATISLGVHTVIPNDGTSVEDFIRTADKALYKAKESRNNTAVA